MARSWPVVLFLDIDGVLNGHQFMSEALSCKIDPVCVQRLNRILIATDARIVLSSAWRYIVHGHDATLTGFHYMLRTHGLLGSMNGSNRLFVDLTCRDEDIPERPDQIRAWLKYSGHRDQQYVILDDLEADWGDLRIVLTDGAVGLTDDDVERAIKILMTESEVIDGYKDQEEPADSGSDHR